MCKTMLGGDKMQFGMPPLLELNSTEDYAKLCYELDLSFIELNMNLPAYQVNRIDIAHFSKIAEQYGIYYTLHLDENLNPCDFNDKVATAYSKTVLQAIEIAKRLNVPILNMHLNSGVWFTLPNKKVFLFEKYKPEFLRKLTDFRNACEKTIGDANINICVENCGDFGNKLYIKDGLELLLESSAFALTFDVGHNAGADYSDEQTIIENIAYAHP